MMDTKCPITALDGREVESDSQRQRSFPFLELPPELRNQIYHDWLTILDKQGERKVLSIDEYMFRFQILPSILLNNKQILSEATPIFASTNVIHLQGRPFGPTQENQHPRYKAFIKYTVKHRKFLPCSRDESEHNYELELPPVAVRPLLKRINITLYAPYWREFTDGALRREVTKDEKIWEAEDVDWLYPTREMKALGFTRVEHLAVKIVHDLWQHGSVERTNEFKAWTREQIRSMVDAKDLRIQV
jgi:hypothetical protein